MLTADNDHRVISEWQRNVPRHRRSSRRLFSGWRVLSIGGFLRRNSVQRDCSVYFLLHEKPASSNRSYFDDTPEFAGASVQLISYYSPDNAGISAPISLRMVRHDVVHVLALLLLVLRVLSAIELHFNNRGPIFSRVLPVTTVHGQKIGNLLSTTERQSGVQFLNGFRLVDLRSEYQSGMHGAKVRSDVSFGLGHILHGGLLYHSHFHSRLALSAHDSVH